MFFTNDSTILKKLLSLFFPYKAQLILIGVCLCVYTLISFSLPLVKKYLIDDGILQMELSSVIFFVAALLILSFVDSITEMVKEYVRSGMTLRIKKKLYEDAFLSLEKVNIQYFVKKSVSEILNNLEIDISRIIRICDNNSFFVITQGLSFLGGMVGLFIIDWRLAVIVICFIPVKFFTIRLFSKKNKIIIDTYIYTANRFAHWFGDALSGMKEIRLFDFAKEKKKEFSDSVYAVANEERKLTFLDSMNVTADSLLVIILESVLYVCGALLVINGELSVGSLFAFIAYSGQVMRPISAVLNMNYFMVGIIPSAKRYFDFLDEAHNTREKSGHMILESIDTISFHDVSFMHDDCLILNKLNFTIQRGEKVAVIGKNGSGKSTLFNLLERFYEPCNGSIRINGVTINEYDLESYRRCFVCTNQDNHLFDLPIKENITLYKNIPDDVYNFAIKESGVIEFDNDKKGETIGQSGNKLSGGQKQKVIFARMLVRDKWCYLFDEATSSMDTESEAALLRSFHTILKSKTVVMIAHKFNFLQYVDRIIKINDDGSITEYSSLSLLMADMPDIETIFALHSSSGYGCGNL